MAEMVHIIDRRLKKSARGVFRTHHILRSGNSIRVFKQLLPSWYPSIDRLS
jgi:hypothetical protein